MIVGRLANSLLGKTSVGSPRPPFGAPRSIPAIRFATTGTMPGIFRDTAGGRIAGSRGLGSTWASASAWGVVP